MPDDRDAQPLRHRNPSRVRVRKTEEDPHRPDRRRALAFIAGQGVGIPAACILGQSAINDAKASDIGGRLTDNGFQGADGTVRRAWSDKSGFRQSPIIRDFANPIVELHRLLREASEVEHALMVQYLYAAYSLKPDYEALIGYGDPNASDMLGVAVQEMQHLAQVNQMLVALGAAPCMLRQDFPYEPDIYPFPFTLEPLGRTSLAKYVYTEAPADALDRSVVRSGAEALFVAELDKALGPEVRPNHIGSLYSMIIAISEEIVASGNAIGTRLQPWIEPLKLIQKEGEEDHFEFFKSVFLGNHPVFEGIPDVWALPADDPRYPSRPLPINPSAYLGHENQIEGDPALNIAWLGNLHYWTVLLLLDFGYRHQAPAFLELARVHMMGPFWSIMRALPTHGTGMPFDLLSMGYSPGVNAAATCGFIKRMLEEANGWEELIADALPADFPPGTCSASLKVLDEIAPCDMA